MHWQVPHALRAQVWLRLVTEGNMATQTAEELYEEYHTALASDTPNDHIAQTIDSDCPRTFPGVLTESDLHTLRDVLVAFSKHNIKVN